MAVGLVGVLAASPGTAWGYWAEAAAGTGSATVATLPEMAVAASSPIHSARVDVQWTPPVLPPGMTVAGYRVQRTSEGVTVDACGSTVTEPLPPDTTGCTDPGLEDGAFVYSVTALAGSWTTSGQTQDEVVVAADRVGPDIRLGVVDGDRATLDVRGGQHILFFSSAAPEGGSARIDAELTDSGVGPASVRFPAIAAAGWSHPEEEVTSGTGTAPTVTYRSSPVVFAAGASSPGAISVTGLDERGNESTVTVQVTDDPEAPTGGALRVNGLDATVAGSTSVATTGFAVDAVTEFAEEATSTQAGILDTSLIREWAPLVDGECGAFGDRMDLDVDAPSAQDGLADGCYRYSLLGIDRVGNRASIRTIVLVDTAVPSGGALRANGTDATPEGSMSYDRTGGWGVSRSDYSDAGTGMLSSTLERSTAPLSDGSCGASGSTTTVAGSPAESGVVTGCVRYTLTGMDLAGLSASISTTVLVDLVAPTGGGLVVNGVAATGAGSSSTSTSSTVVVQSVTDYADAHAGMASSVLTRTFAPMAGGVCGAFDPDTTETVDGAVTLVGLPDGCHRFALTGTDLAGNESTVSSTVRLDASAPAGGDLVAGGVAATTDGVLAYARTNPVEVAWTVFADPESGMASARVQRTTSSSLSGGSCSTSYGSASNLSTSLLPESGSATQTLSTGSARCYRYVLTGTNAFGVTSSLEVTVMFDASSPTGTGRLRVNNSTSANTTSTTGQFTVSALRTFSDAQSGLVSSTLTRTSAPVSASTCGEFDPATTIELPDAVPIDQGPLDPGCYRYTQTATNLVGGVSTVSTTVRVDTTAPVGGALTANGTEGAAGTGSVSMSTTGAWTVERTDFVDAETTLTSTLTRAVATGLSNGACSRFGSAVTVVDAPVEAGITGGCIRYVLAGRNTLNLAAPSLTVIVRVDTTPPTGGALRVNGVSASPAGTTSTSATGTFTISSRTTFSDPHTGMDSTTLVRTSGPSCDALDPSTSTELTGAVPLAQTDMPAGCHRYELTGVSTVGLTSTISTFVVVP